MARVWELCIYAGGTAILADPDGETVWASDADDEFNQEFDTITHEDGDDIAQYLEDEGILPTGTALDIVESDDTGLHEAVRDELDELEADDEDEE